MSSSKDNNIYKKTSFLTGVNSSFIEKFYSDYLSNPEELPKDWKLFFDGLKDNEEIILKNLRGPGWSKVKKNYLGTKNIEKNLKENLLIDDNTKIDTEESVKAIALIRAYRIRGHLIAKLDPLGMMERKYLH